MSYKYLNVMFHVMTTVNDTLTTDFSFKDNDLLTNWLTDESGSI